MESQREPRLLAHFLGDVAIYTALQPPMGHDSPSLDTASICDFDQHTKDQEPRTMQAGAKDNARRVIARTLQEPMTKSHGPGAKVIL